MTARRVDIADLPDWPALLGAEQAAAYCGISRNTFELLVDKGRFPGPVKLPIRRKLWQRTALDSAVGADDFDARKTKWKRRHEDRPAKAG